MFFSFNCLFITTYYGYNTEHHRPGVSTGGERWRVLGEIGRRYVLFGKSCVDIANRTEHAADP